MNDERVRALLPHLPMLTVLGQVEHVTQAAEVLGVPQPAVSRALRTLEKRLGVQLVERAGRGIRLTAAARMLLPYAQRALTEVADGADAMLLEEGRARITVRLAFQTSLGEQLVPQTISAVKHSDPEIRFDLHQGARQACVDLLTQGRVHIALVSQLDALPEEFTSVHLFDQRLAAIVPVGHPLSGRRSVRVGQLAAEPLVTLKHGYGLRDSVDALFARTGARARIAFEGEDLPTIRGLVAAQLGVAVVPATPAAPPGCAQIVIDDVTAKRDMGAAFRSHSLSAASGTVLHALKSQARDPGSVHAASM